MTWSRQEPIFPWHPKVMGLSDLAFRLCVTARDYATLMRTEGFIAERLVPRLVGLSRRTKRLEAAIAELTTTQPGERHPLWEPADGGYQVHDYADYASDAQQEIAAEPAARTAAKVAGGKARAAGAVRVGGRFVKAEVSPCKRQGDIAAAGGPAGDAAGAAGDQQPPAGTSSRISLGSAGTSKITSRDERNARAAGAAGASSEDTHGAPDGFAALYERAIAEHPGDHPWLAVCSVTWEDVKGGALSPIERFTPILRQRQKGQALWRVAAALRAYLRDPRITLPGPADFCSKYNDYAPAVRRGPTTVPLPPRPDDDEIARMRAHADATLPWRRRREA